MVEVRIALSTFLFIQVEKKEIEVQTTTVQMIDKGEQTEQLLQVIDTTDRQYIETNGLRLHGTEVISDGKGICHVDIGNLRYQIGMITTNSKGEPVFVPAKETKAEEIASSSDDN